VRGPCLPSLLPSQVVNQVLERTSSGGFCGNDTLMHVTLPSLPFGGIGRSKSPNLPSVSQVGSHPRSPSRGGAGSRGDGAPSPEGSMVC